MRKTAPAKRSSSVLAWAVVATVLVALVALFFVRTRAKDAIEAPSEETGAVSAEASVPVPAEAAPASPARAARDAPAAQDAARLDRTERIDAARRTLLLAAIAKALEDASTEGADTKGPPRAAGSADAGFPFEEAYLWERIDEIRPLVQTCYDNALAVDASLSGAITLRITVIADEAYGGLITDSEIIDGNIDPGSPLAECVRESMYALRLKAPEGRGRAVLTTRYVFARDDE